MRVDAVTGNAVAYFDSERFAAALQRTAGISAAEATRMANSASLQFNKGETAILVNNGNDLWHYDVLEGVLTRLTNNKDSELEEDFSPDGKLVSFVRGNNLFVVDVAKGDEKQLTRDGGEKIFNGYLDWVYEEELYGRGQKRGYWWSPDSKLIAFLRLDESPVPKFVLANDIPTDQLIENTDYPQAGDGNPFVRTRHRGRDEKDLRPDRFKDTEGGREIAAEHFAVWRRRYIRRYKEIQTRRLFDRSRGVVA